MKKIFIQCGYESRCKNKDCLKCPRKKKHNLNLTLAEEIIIEDFAVCDLKSIIEANPKEMELMQKIATKLMKKVYKDEK